MDKTLISVQMNAVQNSFPKNKMPTNSTIFKRTKKFCENCGKILKLKNNRDIKRKRFCSHKCSGKGTFIPKRNEEHPNWKGHNVSYAALHIWIRKHKPKPSYCENCKKVGPYDVANISQKYIRDINDFKWLCRKCHQIEDGRILNLRNQK